jgi:hypothetical protein
MNGQIAFKFRVQPVNTAYLVGYLTKYYFYSVRLNVEA